MYYSKLDLLTKFLLWVIKKKGNLKNPIYQFIVLFIFLSN